jgi:hypothetical protein
MSKDRSYQIRTADLDTLGLRFFFPIHPVFILTNMSRLSGKWMSPNVYVNQRLQIQFGAPDDERYAARNILSLQ